MPLAKPREGNPIGFHVYPSTSDEGTLGDPETVIWSSIRQLCSQDVAEGLAMELYGIAKKKDREAVARNLKLYIRQASEFYDAARSAKPNTAPLIYYYSCLNLGKAICEMRQPRFHRHPECYRHGLSWRPDPRHLVNFPQESVSVTTRGVWHALWESVQSVRCPVPNPAKIRIKDLFLYCPEVSVEVSRTLGLDTKLIKLENSNVVFAAKSSDAWLRFSVRREDLRDFRLSAAGLISQVATVRSGYIETTSADPMLRTFESTVPQKVVRGQTILAAIYEDILGLNIFAHLARDGKLQYNFALQSQLPVRIPQLMVSYTILFWLGSLVRYDPHSVNALMDSEYWMLIDGFMSQSRLWLLELFEWALYQAETTLWIVR